VLPFLENKFYRGKLCISHLSPASGRKTEGDTLKGGQLTCCYDRAGELGLRPFFRANSAYIIKYGVRMQLCIFQALRVLAHFPLPDLEHFYVWQVEHTNTYDSVTVKLQVNLTLYRL